MEDKSIELCMYICGTYFSLVQLLWHSGSTVQPKQPSTFLQGQLSTAKTIIAIGSLHTVFMLIQWIYIDL